MCKLRVRKACIHRCSIVNTELVYNITISDKLGRSALLGDTSTRHQLS